ncbi:MAG: carboxypeptidase-like regulatory domain-containing protein [Thermoguttaceae bacterium]|jgi:protocatechuate 3,4-dioxygenase beta subunit
MKHLYTILLATMLLSLAAIEALAVEPAGSLAGQVLQADGKPAAGATIWLVGGDYEEGWKILEKTIADDQGQFVFAKFQSKYAKRQRDLYPQMCSRNAQGQIGWEDRVWAWPKDTPRQDIQIKLAAVQKYQGCLVDASGQPIAKARIRPRNFLFDIPGQRNRYQHSLGILPEFADECNAETDENGSFTLNYAPAGAKAIAEIAAPDFGTVYATWSLKESVTLRLDRLGKIHGSVASTSGSDSLEGIKFYLRPPADPNSVKESEFTISPRNYGASTDKGGVFQFNDIPPGKYIIYPQLTESTLPFTADNTAEFEVKSGTVTNVSIPLRPAIEVRGQVVDAETGRGIPDVWVYLNRLSEKGPWRLQRASRTDAEGKYVAYTEPGQIMVQIHEAPEGYLRPDPKNSLPKLDAAQALTYPTIKLAHAAQLEGLVVDESGKPVPDAEVQALLLSSGMPNMESIITDSSGRFSIKGLDAEKTFALRARSPAGVSNVLENRLADIRTPLRLELSPKQVFTLRGALVDQSGRPIRAAKINVSSGWMLGSIGSSDSVGSGSTDNDGRFKFENLWPGFKYTVNVDTEGFAKYESKRIKGQPGTAEDFGKLTLIEQKGSVEGMVADSAGKPLAGVRVFNSGDAPSTLSTTSDGSGRFRLDGLRSGGVFVLAEKDGYRLKAAATNSNATGLTVTLLRTDEPAPPWKPVRAPATYAEQLEAAGKILEKLHSLPQKSSYPWTYRFMARIDPAQAIEWTKNAKGSYKSESCRLAAEKVAEADVEEAITLLAPYADYSSFMTLQTLVNRYAASDPAKAERLAEEAVLLARKLDQPERTYALAKAGELVVRLGKTEQGRKLIEEAAAMADKMGTADSNVYYRGLVAGAIAPLDLPRAMSLVEPTDAGSEKDRALARIAKIIALTNLEKALELVNRLEKQSNQRDNTRLAIAYQLAPTRLKDALGVVDSMDTFAAAKTKAEAYGWLAAAIAPKDRQTAWSLVDKSFSLFEKNAQEMRGWSSSGGRGAFAAQVVAQANAIGYPDVGSLIDRVLAMRSLGDEVSSPRELQKPTVIMAKILALVDPETAKHLLETVAPRIDQYTDFDYFGVDARDWYQAWALADLAETVSFWQQRLETARTNPDFKLDQNSLDTTIELLTTPATDRPQLMLRYIGGHWFPGED